MIYLQVRSTKFPSNIIKMITSFDDHVIHHPGHVLIIPWEGADHPVVYSSQAPTGYHFNALIIQLRIQMCIHSIRCCALAGVYILIQKRYLPPPPRLPKIIFSPLLQHVVFWILLCPFCLNSSLYCIYSRFLLPIFSVFLPFLLSSFFFPFPPFSFPLSSFFFPAFLLFLYPFLFR